MTFDLGSVSEAVTDKENKLMKNLDHFYFILINYTQSDQLDEGQCSVMIILLLIVYTDE